MPLSSQDPPFRGNWCSDFYHRKGILPVLGLHVKGIRQYALFGLWLLLLNVTSVRFNHVVAWISSFFLSLTNSFPLQGYAPTCLSILLFVDIWVVSGLGILWIRLLAILCMSFCGHGYLFLWLLALRKRGKSFEDELSFFSERVQLTIFKWETGTGILLCQSVLKRWGNWGSEGWIHEARVHTDSK